MKTLDEVIDIFAECFENKWSISSIEADMTIGEDALHYLKMYRSDTMNEPLTFTEVRQMLGCPVWMEFFDVKGWMLVNLFDSTIDDTKGIALADRYGTDFVFSEESVDKGDVLIYRRQK